MSNNYTPDNIRPLPNYLPAELNGSFSIDDGRGGSEVQLREYLRIVFKYRAVIGASIVLCVLLALIYAFTATPRYTAESKVRIGTYQPVLAAAKIEDMLQEKSKESTYLETQIQEMKSFSLADKVLEDFKIRDELIKKKQTGGLLTSLFGSAQTGLEEVPELVDRVSGYKTPIAYIKRYLDLIQIKPVRRTSLVVIQATAENPAFAAQVANKHALSYIEWVRTTRVEQQSRGLKFLRSQADELREKVGDLEREIADYAEANAIVAVNKDENIIAQKMSQLNKVLTDATAKRIEAEQMHLEATASLDVASAGFDDASSQNMRTDLATLQAQYGELSAKFTDSYPKVQQLKAQIEGLKKSLQSQREQVARGLKAKALAAAQEEKKLIEELEEQKSQAFELSKRQVQYNVLTRELATSREILENVLKQIKETALSVEGNASSISIVDYAVVPKLASFPQKRLILILGILLGSALGLGLAFLLSYLDNTVRTPEELALVTNLPTLGVVPSFDLEELPAANRDQAAASVFSPTDGSGPKVDNTGLVKVGEKKDSNLPIMYITAPKSLASEAYRTIRTGILLSKAGEPPRTILVSSAQSSEGKTTSAINLAASLASAGGRVVLIDADLRRPSIYQHLSLPSNLPGLVEILTGQAEPRDVTIPDLIKRVSVIPNGQIPPNPAELLASAEMLALIKYLSSEYDYVIIDSPPILPVTDSVILSRYVDGVVLVVKGAATPKKVVGDARRRLQSVGARLLGAILNDVDVRSGDYYYYNRYYYSYYKNDPKKDASAAVG